MSLEDTLNSLKEFDINEFDINDIDFDNIGSWPIAGRILIWVVVFGAVLLKAKINETTTSKIFFAFKPLR